MIQLVADQGLWKPICLARCGPKLSYLMFADDLILFTEASLEKANVIKMCLDLFCQNLGQKVSNAKTHIFFSKSVLQDLPNYVMQTAWLPTHICNNLDKH